MKVMKRMINPYLPAGQEPQYYFLKLLAAIVRKNGGSLTLEPQWLDSVGQGNCIIPIWDSLAQQLILKFSTEPLPVFSIGAPLSVSAKPQPSSAHQQGLDNPPLAAPPQVQQPLNPPIPPSQRTTTAPRVPTMLDDAAIVELENRRLSQQILRDLMEQAPSTVS